uniref:Uncharacterized protein n=1 Tax=Rangifer tarandus platyrhynchus TaxID=3082113 RepID=A0ACB0F4R1_RANTA|nr:unnamed protein product [Rangifer tarandus platyrhynchus]
MTIWPFRNDDVDTKYESIAEHPELEFPDLVTPYSADGRWCQGQLCALHRGGGDSAEPAEREAPKTYTNCAGGVGSEERGGAQRPSDPLRMTASGCLGSGTESPGRASLKELPAPKTHPRGSRDRPVPEAVLTTAEQMKRRA